jgi:hypothetical protein
MYTVALPQLIWYTSCSNTSHFAEGKRFVNVIANVPTACLSAMANGSCVHTTAETKRRKNLTSNHSKLQHQRFIETRGVCKPHCSIAPVERSCVTQQELNIRSLLCFRKFGHDLQWRSGTRASEESSKMEQYGFSPPVLPPCSIALTILERRSASLPGSGHDNQRDSQQQTIATSPR